MKVIHNFDNAKLSKSPDTNTPLPTGTKFTLFDLSIIGFTKL